MAMESTNEGGVVLLPRDCLLVAWYVASCALGGMMKKDRPENRGTKETTKETKKNAEKAKRRQIGKMRLKAFLGR